MEEVGASRASPKEECAAVQETLNKSSSESSVKSEGSKTSVKSEMGSAVSLSSDGDDSPKVGRVHVHVPRCQMLDCFTLLTMSLKMEPQPLERKVEEPQVEVATSTASLKEGSTSKTFMKTEGSETSLKSEMGSGISLKSNSDASPMVCTALIAKTTSLWYICLP